MPYPRIYDNQAGIVDGRTVYTASVCGHVVTAPKVKRCRSCFLAGASRLRLGYPTVHVNGRATQEHRLIAAKALGRPLTAEEVVHHIDMDKTNNRNDNLIICTKAYHRLLHNRMQLLWAERYRRAKQQREATEIYGDGVVAVA